MSAESEPKARVLLPTTVVPQHYDVHFAPDLAEFTFDGKVEISVDVQQRVAAIVLHAKCLAIDSAEVETADGSVVVGTAELDTQLDRVTIQLASEVAAGPAKVRISFRGELNDQMAGFYRSRYTDGNGEEKWMAVTQFEATDARRAFPCWDEPSLKATFSVSLRIAGHLTALGNMPVAQESEDDDGFRTVQFEKTVKMSSYLVAFAVGDFTAVSATTKAGVKVSVHVSNGKKEQGEFALSVATKTLDLFSEFFEIPYPLPKCDMLAVSDFAMGAMENWGLVTYRETALLIEEGQSGVSAKMRVAYVVAHELAHQWFGNLVTMQWWSELWLNEGFATWVGNYAVDCLFPEWQVWTGFSSGYFGTALGLDGLASSHPIEVDVTDSNEINEIFDTISYCKGASVNRMVHAFLGHEAFRKGLVIYLKRHQYGNATTSDLWAALSEASGKDVHAFMDNWTKKVGYPVLTVERTDKEGELSVQQERFLLSGKPSAGEDETVWWCSVAFLSSSSSAVTAVDVKEKSQVVQLAAAGDAWLVANANQTGFFRIKYGPKLLASLGDALASGKLSAIDRIAIENDMFALARSGAQRTSQALDLLKHYGSEENDTVLQDLAKNLGKVTEAWKDEASYTLLKPYFCKLFSAKAAAYGWEVRDEDSDLDKIKRTLVINQAAKYGDQTVVQQAMEYFHGQRDSVASDLRYTMYKLAVQNGGEKEYDEVLGLFHSHDVHADKLAALKALGAAEDEALLRRTLAMGMSDDVRSQDTIYVYAMVAANPKGGQLTWDFLINSWDALVEKFEGTAMLFPRIIASIISQFSSDEKADEIEAFFKTHEAPGAERAILQGLERIRSKAAWVTRDSEDVAAFLARQ